MAFNLGVFDSALLRKLAPDTTFLLVENLFPLKSKSYAPYAIL